MASRSVNPTRGGREGRAFVRAALCALALAVLPACSLFGEKDPPIADDPADRLYNEGLFLLNNKKDFKGRRRSSRRSTASIPIRSGRASR